MSKKVSDEMLIQAILQSGSQAQAAKALGLNPTSMCRRLQNPIVKQKLSDAKAAYLKQAVHELNTQLSGAVKVLCEIMHDETAPQGTRLQAADTILRHGLKYTEIGDIIPRLEALERDNDNV